MIKPDQDVLECIISADPVNYCQQWWCMQYFGSGSEMPKYYRYKVDTRLYAVAVTIIVSLAVVTHNIFCLISC